MLVKRNKQTKLLKLKSLCRYWRYQRSRLYEGPSDVCDIGFTKEMKNVDATFRWSKDNKIYVFKGEFPMVGRETNVLGPAL